MLRSNPTDILTTMNNNMKNLNATNININMMSSCALDALPKQFVSSMKTLFDILDDQHTGYVKYSDIQKGWQDDGCKGLPRGVLDSLRKVTPTNGLLSFERFCAGLKLCLLRNQSECMQKAPAAINKSSLKNTLNVRSPSAPLIEMEHAASSVQNTAWSNNTATTMRSHSMLHAQRALSLPQLSPNSEIEVELATNTNEATTMTTNVYNSPPPPPKPPRAAVNATVTNSNSTGLLTSNVDKAEIRHALQNWQMGILLNEIEAKESGKRATDYVAYRGSADGGSSSATDSGTTGPDAALVTMAVKKSASKRREPRRHTLQNGIDYNLLKRRLKQFEEERDVLLLGLEAVEKARDWYAQQLANVQDKIKYLGRMGTHVEQWSEVQQERLNFQRARVLEINRNLQTLSDTWERGGFPIHFNLAIRTPSSKTNTTSSASRHNLNVVATERLRQQNRLLSNEVNFKSERISLLEREKQMLLRELYELQQRTTRVAANASANGYLSALGQTSPGCSSSSGVLGDADVVY